MDSAVAKKLTNAHQPKLLNAHSRVPLVLLDPARTINAAQVAACAL
jgi:hypothetical protein